MFNARDTIFHPRERGAETASRSLFHGPSITVPASSCETPIKRLYAWPCYRCLARLGGQKAYLIALALYLPANFAHHSLVRRWDLRGRVGGKICVFNRDIIPPTREGCGNGESGCIASVLYRRSCKTDGLSACIFPYRYYQPVKSSSVSRRPRRTADMRGPAWRSARPRRPYCLRFCP